MNLGIYFFVENTAVRRFKAQSGQRLAAIGSQLFGKGDVPLPTDATELLFDLSSRDTAFSKGAVEAGLVAGSLAAPSKGSPGGLVRAARVTATGSSMRKGTLVRIAFRQTSADNFETRRN